jgi:hypothetical protein
MLISVLYECETWLLKSREEHRLKMYEYEKEMLKRIFVPESVSIIRGCRKRRRFRLYSSPNMVAVMKSRRMWEKSNAFRVLMVKPEGKRLLRRHKCR